MPLVSPHEVDEFYRGVRSVLGEEVDRVVSLRRQNVNVPLKMFADLDLAKLIAAAKPALSHVQPAQMFGGGHTSSRALLLSKVVVDGQH